MEEAGSPQAAVPSEWCPDAELRPGPGSHRRRDAARHELRDRGWTSQESAGSGCVSRVRDVPNARVRYSSLSFLVVLRMSSVR